MSTYAPQYFPAGKLGFTTTVAVTGGQLLAISGSNTVAPTSGPTNAWIGVAENDAPAYGSVTVYCEGVHLLTASGSISAGDLVVGAASGQVATIGGDTVYSNVVGIALAAATNGAVVPVRLRG
jgi:hypothetical protein